MLKQLMLLLLICCGCISPNSIDFSKKTPIYNKINIELVYTNSSTPDPVSLKIFELRLKKYHICKNLVINQRLIDLPDYSSWDDCNLKLLKKEIRTSQESADTLELNLFIIYLPGDYIQGKRKSLAGLQFGRNAIAVFKDKCKHCENAVLLHELGHILHIADQSNNPDRKPVNPDRADHCNNSECIMFWEISDDYSDFDENCQEELLKLFN